MNYEKMYKEALERASKIKLRNPIGRIQDEIDSIFPELKESEDDEIRKDIIQFLQLPHPQFVGKREHEKWIAWLEKQGGQNKQHLYDIIIALWDLLDKIDTFSDLQIDDTNPDNPFRKIEHITQERHKFVKSDGYNLFIENVMITNDKIFEKQGEQKPIDESKPKFKAGDWIVYNRDDYSREIIQVYDIRDGRYYFTDNVHFSWSIKECDEKCHLWTIQDAKDGDVLEFGDHGRLVVGIVSYVNKTTGKVDVNCLLENNNFKVGIYYNLDTIKPHPATKEQRDLLFQKMKDAGYEWDYENKELKNIKQNSTWSEEDEKISDAIYESIDFLCLKSFGFSEDEVCDWLKSLKDRIFPQPKQKWSEEDEEKLNSIIDVLGENSVLVKWIKSLKSQSHWKPSKYDISLLEEIAKNIRNNVRPFCSEVSALEDLIKNIKAL